METITLENKTNEVQTIRLYNVNIPITLKPGDFVKLTENDNSQAQYYKTLQEEVLDAKGNTPSPSYEDYDKTVYWYQQDVLMFEYRLKCDKEVLQAGSGNVYDSFKSTEAVGEGNLVHFYDYLFDAEGTEMICWPDSERELMPASLQNVTEALLDEMLDKTFDSISIIENQGYWIGDSIYYPTEEDEVGYYNIDASHWVMVRGYGLVNINVYSEYENIEFDFTLNGNPIHVTEEEPYVTPIRYESGLTTEVLDALANELTTSLVITDKNK